MRRSSTLPLVLLLAACSLGGSGGGADAPSVAPPQPPTGTVRMIGANEAERSAMSRVPSSEPAPSSVSEPATRTVRLAFMTADATVLEPMPTRTVDRATLYERTVEALLAGPTAEEQRLGALRFFDASVKLDRVEVSGNVVQCIRAPCPERRIVRLYFTGNLCAHPGAATNEATLLTETMAQFGDVAATKIYLDGETQNPVGTVGSRPACLEP